MRYLTSFAGEPSDHNRFDVIVIGAGVGGLFAALNLPHSMKTAVVMSALPKDTNSGLAQGGIAICQGPEDQESHVEDTLEAGCRHNDPEAVRVMVKESPDIAQDLMALGVEFDRNPDGSLKLTREGGHSKNRILHTKDSTGAEIVRALAKAARGRDNLTFFDNAFAVDIITDQFGSAGVLAVLGGATRCLFARHLVVATGGIGRLYERTTNMRYSSGDGIAMAIRAGASVLDMEFVQFHPTGLYSPSSQQSFLISEAVRGEGGILRSPKGEPFMRDEHPLKDLAPRDIVARAVTRQMLKHNSPFVYLDVTHLGGDFLRTRFPNIYHRCLEEGLDIARDWIPVRPVAHYLMGGISTDLWGRSSVEGLYACGEAARTGVHGANRLASNSLLEALVFAKRIARVIPDTPRPGLLPSYAGEPRHRGAEFPWDPTEAMERIRRIMTERAFVIRTAEGLRKAREELGEMLSSAGGADLSSIDHFEVINMIQVALSVVNGALSRPSSLGSHWIEG
ncbi:L-aspartate oxidase [Thermanaerovibrio velox DSM 12556]|uniref:L-aspartate oxidase n=1 Tax=Thermanaerovibrio velox DSM 12556 TaxID=926567 RepID=H0UN11_9BACT|nr:L-aspartate oxidase [Thermanaerovibrio velox]EHM09290.1 L-aspartate oxidase [Thermanaerovibrio velox DSM 12556]